MTARLLPDRRVTDRKLRVIAPRFALQLESTPGCDERRRILLLRLDIAGLLSTWLEKANGHRKKYDTHANY